MALCQDHQIIYKKVGLEKKVIEQNPQGLHKSELVLQEKHERQAAQERPNTLQILLKRKKTADMIVNLTIRQQECPKTTLATTCLALLHLNKLLELRVRNNSGRIMVQHEALLVSVKELELLKTPISTNPDVL